MTYLLFLSSTGDFGVPQRLSISAARLDDRPGHYGHIDFSDRLYGGTVPGLQDGATFLQQESYSAAFVDGGGYGECLVVVCGQHAFCFQFLFSSRLWSKLLLLCCRAKLRTTPYILCIRIPWYDSLPRRTHAYPCSSSLEYRVPLFIAFFR